MAESCLQKKVNKPSNWFEPIKNWIYSFLFKKIKICEMMLVLFQWKWIINNKTTFSITEKMHFIYTNVSEKLKMLIIKILDSIGSKTGTECYFKCTRIWLKRCKTRSLFQNIRYFYVNVLLQKEKNNNLKKNQVFSALFSHKNIMQNAMLLMCSLPTTKVSSQFIQTWITSSNQICPLTIVAAIRFS